MVRFPRDGDGPRRLATKCSGLIDCLECRSIQSLFAELANVSKPCSISVAIPAFQGAPHVAEAIRSVLEQNEPASEVLILDDRSEDETVEVAKTEGGDRVRIEINSERLGLAGKLEPVRGEGRIRLWWPCFTRMT